MMKSKTFWKKKRSCSWIISRKGWVYLTDIYPRKEEQSYWMTLNQKESVHYKTKQTKNQNRIISSHERLLFCITWSKRCVILWSKTRVILRGSAQRQWHMIPNNWWNKNILDSFECTYSKLYHFPLQYCCRKVPLEIISDLKSLPWSLTWGNFLWSSLSLKGRKSQRVYSASWGLKVLVKRWVGQDLGILSFRIYSYGPCFVLTGILVEIKDVLRGADWMLAADLQDDFGQNCFFVQWPAGAVSRQLNISCQRPLVVQADGKHCLPALINSGLVPLSLFGPIHALFAGNATEWYPSLILLGNIHHMFGSLWLRMAEYGTCKIYTQTFLFIC